MRESEGESTAATAQVTPSLDLIFDLLSNRRRRYALYYLYDQPDGVATLEEIADAVTTDLKRFSESDGETNPEQQRGRVQMELQHTHLPRLEDAGILEHDHRSETVRYWTQPSLEEWLEHAHHKEQS
ncbi:DUF7344 domain-containing protein [Natronorubrum sulfidifaciens]|uniref:DUF7344 domain-containing protein n=1 Tax=Natronorubrum sulfidifaciens JCM 14089 TaxID=1230460 RepID=L9WIP5_9EURY|nr:hypothetical protein [Natronorubrum sulfidifaciens]ELY48218.1 hypothetical protein C495_02050 [Natronorubrum sulfidifaciens JCM 14089]